MTRIINYRTMNFLGNLIWLVLGGIITSIEYLLAGLFLCVTIIGIPFGLQCFKMAGFVLYPFGRTSVQGARSSGLFRMLFNIIWLLFGGIWISLSHLIFGVLLCITIIGIPFGLQHFKLAELALTPFGRDIIYK